jgi:hypothetical protein
VGRGVIVVEQRGNEKRRRRLPSRGSFRFLVLFSVSLSLFLFIFVTLLVSTTTEKNCKKEHSLLKK